MRLRLHKNCLIFWLDIFYFLYCKKSYLTEKRSIRFELHTVIMKYGEFKIGFCIFVQLKHRLIFWFQFSFIKIWSNITTKCQQNIKFLNCFRWRMKFCFVTMSDFAQWFYFRKINLFFLYFTCNNLASDERLSLTLNGLFCSCAKIFDKCNWKFKKMIWWHQTLVTVNQ